MAQTTPQPLSSNAPATLVQRWRAWWRSLSPVRQDRFAALAPLAAVLLFMAAIVAAFWYLRVEEGEREQEALRRDVEYAQSPESRDDRHKAKETGQNLPVYIIKIRWANRHERRGNASAYQRDDQYRVFSRESREPSDDRLVVHHSAR